MRQISRQWNIPYRSTISMQAKEKSTNMEKFKKLQERNNRRNSVFGRAECSLSKAAGFYWSLESREYSMYYRGPGFLAVVWFGSVPTPSLPLSRQQARPATHRKTEKDRQLMDRWEGVGPWGRSQIIRQRESLVLLVCADGPCILSWPMVISGSVNEFFVAV